MPVRITLLVIGTIGILVSNSNRAFAQEESQTEKDKREAVSAMYQITDLPTEYCSRLKDVSARLKKTIQQVNRKYPRLKILVDNSPYLPQIREYFKNEAFFIETKAMSDADLTRTCDEAYYMLHQLLEGQSGKDEANDLIQKLEK